MKNDVTEIIGYSRSSIAVTETWLTDKMLNNEILLIDTQLFVEIINTEVEVY